MIPIKNYDIAIRYNIEKILAEALELQSPEKLQLVEKILSSFHPLNIGVNKIWADEAEERISSYANGDLPSLNEEETFSKYKR